MNQRLDYSKAAPGAIKTIIDMHNYCSNCGLEHALLELVKLRASQINGCAYCLDMHSKDARSAGESEQRIYGLAVWRETSYYSERERAALALTEAVTQISNGPVSEALYAEAREQFTDKELVNLVTAISVINIWNRFAITFVDVPGSYLPDHPAAKRA